MLHCSPVHTFVSLALEVYKMAADKPHCSKNFGRPPPTLPGGTGKPGPLQSIESQGFGHELATDQQQI